MAHGGTRLGGALVTAAQAAAAPTRWAQHSSDFATYANGQWPTPGAAWDARGIALYEHIVALPTARRQLLLRGMFQSGAL